MVNKFVNIRNYKKDNNRHYKKERTMESKKELKNAEISMRISESNKVKIKTLANSKSKSTGAYISELIEKEIKASGIPNQNIQPKNQLKIDM